ncbi:hypothetical protein F5Y17DRAFT_453852, partial [Xylariaceae sp. FL0594]
LVCGASPSAPKRHHGPGRKQWPTEAREHATYLNKYLPDALLCVQQANDQPVPANIVKSTILGMLSLVAKIQNMPDLQKERQESVKNGH